MQLGIEKLVYVRLSQAHCRSTVATKMAHLARAFGAALLIWCHMHHGRLAALS